MSDGKVEYEITADARGLSTAARAGENSLGGLLSKGRAMAAGLTAAIGTVTAAAGTLGIAIREAAKIETTETGIKTLVKDAGLAKAIVGDLKKLGAETPFELGDLSGAARSLLGAGTQVKDLRQTLLTLGDVASGAQTDLGELALVFNKMRGDAKLTGETLGMLSDRGIGGLREEIAKVSGVPVENLIDSVSHPKVTFEDMVQVFTNLTSNGGLYYRAMISQSETLEGRLSTLSDEFKGLLRVPGEAGLAASKAMVDALISGTQQATRGASIFVKTLELASQNGRLGEFLSISLRLAYAESTLFFLRGMKEAISTIADALGGAVSAALSGDLQGAKSLIKGIFDFSPAGRIRDLFKVDELRAEFGAFTQAGRLALEKGLKETSDAMASAMGKGADKVSQAGDKLKSILSKGTGGGDAKDGDRDGDGIISRREQRKLDLEEKRAVRKANSVKGFSREKAGLAAFGGLDEFNALQFRDGADGTGFEGDRAFPAFTSDRRVGASQMGFLNRSLGGAGTDRTSAFKGLSEAGKIVDERQKASREAGGTDGNAGALEAILLELKRIRTA